MSTPVDDNLNSERLGSYKPNRFIVTLTCQTPFFQINSQEEVESNQDDYLAVYLHEYWHYLQNISTISGIITFILMQELLALFSKTLEVCPSGKISSKGNSGLDADGQQVFANIIKMFTTIQGQMKPAGLRTKLIRDWRIGGIKKEEIELTWNSKKLLRHQLKLDLIINYLDGSSDATVQLTVASGAIQESIAYIIERHLGAQNPSLLVEASPHFPYTVLEHLVEYIVGNQNEPLDIIASIGTLSLMSNNPAASLYDFLIDYRDHRHRGFGPTASLNAILKNMCDQVNEAINILQRGDLFSIEKMHMGRGLAETGAKYIVSVIRKAIQRRKEYPLFDLEFSTKNTPKQVVKSVNKLLRQFPPCDVLQERSGNIDDLMRDFLGTSQLVRMQSGFLPSDGIRTLQSQQHFMQQHLRTKGFIATNCIGIDGDSRCPYYTVCDLPLRQDAASVCDQSPWEHWERGPNQACWYSSGVASTAGIVSIKVKS